MTRDEIEREETIKTMIASALMKQCLTSEEIDAAPIGEFMQRYDWVLAIWPDGALLVRDTGKEAGFLRCNSIPCDTRTTALKLHAVCRGPGNLAPEPPSLTKH